MGSRGVRAVNPFECGDFNFEDIGPAAGVNDFVLV